MTDVNDLVVDKAVLHSQTREKELQLNEQLQQELKDVQRDANRYQDMANELELEKESMTQQLRQLKEDADMELVNHEEQLRVSQETQLWQTQRIEQQQLEIDALQMHMQSLEAQVATMSEQCQSQQLSIDEYTSEIQKLKDEKSEIWQRLQDDAQHANITDMHQQVITQQLTQHQHENSAMKDENKRLSEKLRELKSMQQTYQVLVTENQRYQQLLSSSQEKENQLQHALEESHLSLSELEFKYQTLLHEHEQEQLQREQFENMANDMLSYEHEMDELQKTSMSTATSTSVVHDRQKTTRLLMPQSTLLRIQSSRSSTLKVPGISRQSTQRLVSRMSVLMTPMKDVPTSMTLFEAVADDEEADIDGGQPELALADSDGAGSRSLSVCTDTSYMRDNDFDEEKADEAPAVSPLLDNDKLRTRPATTSALTMQSVQEMQRKMQAELNQEFASLEKDLERQYNVEFEKSKQEVMKAHQESLDYATNAYKLLREQYEAVKQLYDQNCGRQKTEQSSWETVIGHIFAV